MTRFARSMSGFGFVALTAFLASGASTYGAWNAAVSESGAGADDPPESIELIGVIRDFKERTVSGGHPDFEKRPNNGFALYCGNVEQELDSDRKPVFKGGGYKVNSQWRDAQGRPIAPHMYNASLGDVAGSKGATDSGAIQSAETFHQWFRDVPGMNMSMPLSLRFERQSNGSYVFDDKWDPQYANLGGFFPIDDALFGESPGLPSHNYHFTFELHTEFTYDADGQQVFQFIGDDDVWVFIDNKLVIDLGGVHSATQQFVDLNRLNLDDGKTYKLDFFFAERHRTQSNFRIVTNLKLNNVTLPTVSASFD